MAKVEFQRREAVKHFHRSSLSRKKKKMEYKNSNFDSPVSTSRSVKKYASNPKKKDKSCQTLSFYPIQKDNSTPDLVLGSSPSTTPSKQIATSIISTADMVPVQDTCPDTYHCEEPCKVDKCENINASPATKYLLEIPCENIPVIQKDMDAMSINFETPYLSNHKRVQRKLSLPQIKLLKKNSSQESDSPPDGTPGSGSKKFFSGSSASGTSMRFLSTLKKRKHALKRALSFQNSSTSSEDKVQPSELNEEKAATDK
ncbi:hypothetical protein X975_20102, partial [Stegodyphus mimosarum]